MKTVAIIGAGPAGLAVATKLKDYFEVDLFEAGKTIEERVSDKNKDLTSGVGGSGLFSDGKLTLHPKVGTSQFLIDLYGERFISEKLLDVNNFYINYGASVNIKKSEYTEEFKRQSRQAGFSLIDRAAVNHIGSNCSESVIKNILNDIKDKINIYCKCKIEPNFINNNNKIKIFITFENGTSIEKEYDYLILSVGRSGASWIKTLYENTNLPYSPGIVDIGVRLECNQYVFENFYNEFSFEPKLSRISSFGERTRSFCSCLNPNSHVALEVYEHITDECGSPLKCVNGHSYSENDDCHYSGNANMAILVSCKFTDPFKDSIGYARSIGKLTNTLADGNVLAQSYRDFKKNRRSTIGRIKETGISPTLENDVVYGDISFAIPYRILKAIEEFIDSLEILFPGVSNNILYFPEIKMYSNQAKIDNENLNYCGYQNIYVCGDGSGLTRSLSTATMHGMLVADRMINLI
jgi:uncharacterized FAD-dependent dehydrogenase